MDLLKYLPNINSIKYHIYILFMIIFFIYIIYLITQEDKYDIILPHQYIFINRKGKSNNANVFFTLDNYNEDLPMKVDLRSKCPPVYFQGKLGLCHINAACFVYRYICLNNNIDFNPSRMFCEYNILHLRSGLDKISIKNRVYQIELQGGATIEDINSLLYYGACKEEDYPYPSETAIEHNTNIIEALDNLKKNIYSEKDLINISEKYKEIDMVVPTKEMYINAQNHKILDVYNLEPDINIIKKYLNRHGPVLFSFARGDWVLDLLSINWKLEIFKQIRKNENLNNTDKGILDNKINAFTKFINDNDHKPHFNSYYEDMNKIKLSDNLLNLSQKYSDEHEFLEHDTLKKEMFSKATMKDLTLKYPKDLIKQSEEYLMEQGIDLENIKNNKKVFEENNLPDEYINNYTKFTMDKIKKTLRKSKRGKDISGFIDACMGEKNTGHCMTIVGYDDKEQVFIIANSWGTEWGDNGYFYLDYAFVNNDFWGLGISDTICINNTKDGNI